MWDMAEHGVDGVRLSEAVRNVDCFEFVKQIHRMSLWPPIFPLLECPVFLLFGYEYNVASGFMGVLFALCLLAVFFVGLELSQSTGILIGGLAVALMASSPIFQLFGALIMLEIPGALFLLLSLGTYIRFQRTRSSKDWILTCLMASALFFIKYNYGLMWIFPVILNESWSVLSVRTSRQKICNTLIQYVSRHRFFVMILTVYVVFLIAIGITGGWIWKVAGQKIIVTSLGNPVYFLIWFLIIRFFLRPRENLARAKFFIQNMNVQYRIFLLIVILPIFIWMLIPYHMKDFFYFMENRSSDIPFWSMENLLFYPRVFFKEYSPSSVIGLIVFILGICSLLLMKKNSTTRIIYLALGVGLFVSFFHPYKQARFFFVVAPLLWLVFSNSLGQVFRVVTRKCRPSLVSAISVLLVLVCFVLATVHGFDINKLRINHRSHSVSGSVRPLLDVIADNAWTSQESVVLGYWNCLSPGLVEWHCRLLRPGKKGEYIPHHPRHFSNTLDPTLLTVFAQSEELERIFILDAFQTAPEWAAEFRRENFWLPAVSEAINRDQRFVCKNEYTFSKAGYRLIVFHKAY